MALPVLFGIFFKGSLLSAEPVQKINPENSSVLGIRKTIHFTWYRLENVDVYEFLLHKLEKNGQWGGPERKWIPQQNNTSVISLDIAPSSPENGTTYAWNVRPYKKDSTGKIVTDSSCEYHIFSLCPQDSQVGSAISLKEFKHNVDTKVASYFQERIRQLAESRPIPEITLKKCREASSLISKWSAQAEQYLKKNEGQNMTDKETRKLIDELLKGIEKTLLED